MAVSTYLRCGSLASEELLAMAIEAGIMFGKLGHIWKRHVTLAHLIRIISRKLVTGVAGQFLPGHMSSMGELGVVRAPTGRLSTLSSLASLWPRQRHDRRIDQIRH